MRISAIVAMSENKVIGKDNQLPWHLPADLKHFKKITLGHPIIMGRNTYESIGKPLPGRKNIVVTRNPSFNAPGCIVAQSIEEALQLCQSADDVFIIGGAEIFKNTMSLWNRLYLTVIHQEFVGDVYFPPIDLTRWKMVESEEHTADSENKFDYGFYVYEKTSS